MNVLGLLFPASLFQHSNPPASPEKDDLKTKCNSAADIFRPSENKIREAQGIKCQKHVSDHGCSKKSSGDLSVRIGQLTDIVQESETPLTLSHVDVPAKRTSKEKKRKKGKSKALLLLDNNIASETDGASKISISSKSVPDKASESTLKSDRLNNFLGTADTERLTSIKKSSSESTALRHLASVKKTINGTRDIKFARKQEKITDVVRNSSNTTASSASEPISVFLKDARDKYRSTDSCKDESNGYSFVMERSEVTQNEVAEDTNSCFRSFLADSRACCPGNLHIPLCSNNADTDGIDNSASLGVKEDDKKDCIREVTSSRVPVVEPIQKSRHNKRNSQISKGSSSAPCYLNNSKKFGKENVNLTWQRTGRYIGSSQTDVRKIPDPNLLSMDAASADTTAILKHRSSEEDGLLPTLDFPHYSKDWFQRRPKYSGISSQKKCRTQGHVLVETGDIHARPSQYVSRPRKGDFTEKNFQDRSKNKLIPHFKEVKANHGKNGLWVNKSNLCRPGTREALLNEVKPNDGATSIKDVKPESNQVSSSSVCSGIELSYHSTTREINSRVGSHKWIPVDGRDSQAQMLKNSSDNDHTNTVEGSKDKDDYCSAFDYISKKLPVYICSDLAEKTLEASYTSQTVSESFQLERGSPIAEFEKLLYSASPVVALSVFQPSIALREIWNWYEGPGNFGLQVKAEDFQNSKGSEADVSFFAHFVPFLSAVQLFGSENTGDCSCPSSSEDISSFESVAETSLDDDSHVIFEYFEREPPQQRKPLLAKIKELVKFGASSSQIYGDPSNLECLNLEDLHPASWYSVAWYPIYRIPEGCFRASFLTYHSLGHLHLRCTKSCSVEENTYCVLSPSLGMQSYNAQGECWLYPKKPDKLLDASELFKRRLRTLEETAALFSRGHVRKEKITVGNRHPDYEFFLSRKR